MTWCYVGLALLGMGMFGYSLTQQTNIQGQMNDTMAQLNRSIYDTNRIVNQTSVALNPLVKTTRSLANIEYAEQKTVSHLTSMNTALQTIGHNEQGIVNGLVQLTSTTLKVHSQLTSATSLNQAVQSNNSTAYSDATLEQQQVAALTALTPKTTTELATLNHRLAVLKLLP